MVKHIILFRLKNFALGNDKNTNAQVIKEKLESLYGKIPGLLKMEVGINFNISEQSSDISLYSEFESKESLDNYQIHPLHKEIMPFVSETRSERRVVDYEI
jgi:hypothetical protein